MSPWDKCTRFAADVGRLLGRKGAVMASVSVASSFALSVVEYGIAVFLMLFLFSLGFVAHYELPSWFPFDPRALSPAVIWVSLFLIVIVQAGARIGAYQSKIILTELVNARLKMVLGYTMLKRESLHALPLSEVDFYMAECFPKATGFVFYCTQLVSFCVQAVMVSIGMFWLASGEALVGILGLCVMCFLILQFNRITLRISETVPVAQAGLERTKLRIIRNWILIRILRMRDREYRKYLSSVFLYYKHSAGAYFFGNLGGALMPVLGIVVIAGTVIANFRLFKTPAVQFVAFLYLFVRLQQKVANGSNLLGGLFTYRAQFRKAVEMFASLSREELREALLPQRSLRLLGDLSELHVPEGAAAASAPSSRPAPGELPTIIVRDAAFKWPGMERPAFEGLSLTIPGGSQFGMIGPNGSGKSTLLGVILGVYRPSSGEVRVGGSEASAYFEDNPDSIAYVGAEPYLIHGTIRENLTYGLTNAASEDDVWQALQTVRLAGFVRGIPAGLKHIIQENGEGLSSGQKQRLTIARAFLRRPSLLVLDEPSANLDETTEETIVNTLKELKGRCTVIIVSHKLSVLREVDATLDMGSLRVSEPSARAEARVS